MIETLRKPFSLSLKFKNTLCPGKFFKKSWSDFSFMTTLELRRISILKYEINFAICYMKPPCTYIHILQILYRTTLPSPKLPTRWDVIKNNTNIFSILFSVYRVSHMYLDDFRRPLGGHGVISQKNYLTSSY